MVSFLPDTSRDEYGNITIDFGERFENVILVLKRVDFGGVINIEVKIQQLMTKTLIDSKKQDYDASANVAQWKALGEEAYKTDPVKYRAAEITHWDGENPPFELGATVEESFLSLQTTSLYAFCGDEGPTEWYSDLPCLQYVDNSPFALGPIEVFDAKLPNLVDGGSMFGCCSNLTSFSSEMPSLTNASKMFYECSKLNSWTVELPNSLTDASYMFQYCSGLRSWTVELPNSLQDASEMFAYCSGLNSFTTPSGTLPNSLQDASEMFAYCSGLTSWTVELPNSLTDASRMFSGCSELKSFTPSLAGLTNCTNFNQMFFGCKLNEKSIRNVLTTLPDQTGKTKLYFCEVGCDGTIDQATRKELGALAQRISGERNYYITLWWN